MLNFIRLVLGPLQTNSYLLYSEESKECFIIDPADEADVISETVEQKGLIPKGILLTHGHSDHAAAAMDLKLMYQIPIYGHGDDLFLLKRIKETAEYFLKRPVDALNIDKIDIKLEETDSLELGGEKLLVIKTPGHTPGCVCFYIPQEDLLFSGDTLFAQGLRGRTDFKYSSTAEIFNSLGKLMELPENTLVLSGHGEETTIGREMPKYRKG